MLRRRIAILGIAAIAVPSAALAGQPEGVSSATTRTRGASVQAQIDSRDGGGAIFTIGTTRIDTALWRIPGRPESATFEESFVDLDAAYAGGSLSAETPEAGLAPYPFDPQMEGGTIRFQATVVDSTVRGCVGQSVWVAASLVGTGDPQANAPLRRAINPTDPSVGLTSGLRRARMLQVREGTISSCLGEARFGVGEGTFFEIVKTGANTLQAKPPHMPAHSDESAGASPGAAYLAVPTVLPGIKFLPSYEGTGPAGPTRRSPRISTTGWRPDDGLEEIFDPDSRLPSGDTTKFPMSAIGLITGTWSKNGKGFGCTGWLISPNTVATAGHCVFNYGGGGGWATSVSFTPGINGSGVTPFPTCGTSGVLHSFSGWVKNGNHDWDMGAIRLNCNVGSQTGWFGLYATTGDLEGWSTRIRGYPGDKPPGTQWTSVDYVRDDDDELLFYRNDTVKGMSGSPVYKNITNCGKCAMAVHSGFQQGVFNDYNRGTRIDYDVKFDWLVGCINLASF